LIFYCLCYWLPVVVFSISSFHFLLHNWVCSTLVSSQVIHLASFPFLFCNLSLSFSFNLESFFYWSFSVTQSRFQDQVQYKYLFQNPLQNIIMFRMMMNFKCYQFIFSEREAKVMKANSWLYHYYMVQSRLQYSLSFGGQTSSTGLPLLCPQTQFPTSHVRKPFGLFWKT